MKNPYPVAFLVTVVICAIIIVYHVAFRDEGGPSLARTASAPVPEETAAEAPVAPPPPTVTFGAPRSSARALLDTTAPQAGLQPSERRADASLRTTTPETARPRIEFAPSTPAAAVVSRDGQTATQPERSPIPAPAAASATATEAQPTATLPGAGAVPAVSAAPVPAPAPAVTPRTYAIKPGDNFSSIALALYGSDEYWDEIAQANPLVDPTKLKVGQVIYLPSLEAIRGQRDAAAGGATTSESTTYYVVRTGDTLWNIAVQYYENGRLWRHLYNANRSQIGPDPDKLEAGTKLRIPPPPDTAR